MKKYKGFLDGNFKFSVMRRKNIILEDSFMKYLGFFDK
jgi:hypothetical protein